MEYATHGCYGHSTSKCIPHFTNFKIGAIYLHKLSTRDNILNLTPECGYFSKIITNYFNYCGDCSSKNLYKNKISVITSKIGKVPSTSQLYPHNVINSAIVFSTSNSSSSSYISSSPLSSKSMSVDSPPDAFALTLGLSSVGCKSLAAKELESNSECDSVLSELVAELEREGPGCSLSNKAVDDVLEPGKTSEDVPVDVTDGVVIGFSSVDSFVVVDLSPPKAGNKEEFCCCSHWPNSFSFGLSLTFVPSPPLSAVNSALPSPCPTSSILHFCCKVLSKESLPPESSFLLSIGQKLTHIGWNDLSLFVPLPYHLWYFFLGAPVHHLFVPEANRTTVSEFSVNGKDKSADKRHKKANQNEY
uniref:Uncharacterized protein n=1 Tax=Glossina austeni TaxID=7395 RepID=A0A1A9UVE9_GLOAU